MLNVHFFYIPLTPFKGGFLIANFQIGCPIIIINIFSVNSSLRQYILSDFFPIKIRKSKIKELFMYLGTVYFANIRSLEFFTFFRKLDLTKRFQSHIIK